jgi:hypothetical protein
MSSITHTYHHLTDGAKYQSGLALENMSVDGSGNSDADAQFSVEDGYIWDEDIQHTIADGSPQELSTIAQIPIFYRSGASGNWRKIAATNFPVAVGATPLAYWNEYTGATWQATEAGSGDFVLVHYYAGNDVDEPVFGIMGQDTYATKSAAREGASVEIANLAYGGLSDLTPEFVPIATVIWETKTTFSNTPQCRVVSTDAGLDYVDWRKIKGSAL